MDRPGQRRPLEGERVSAVNESIVEDAAVTCFGELGYAFGRGPQLAPAEPPTAR